MKVVLLCGGRGKRMFPLTEDKALLKFLGKTLLEHQIRGALKAGWRDFVIIGNPGNMKQLQKVATTIPGIQAEYILQKTPGGIGQALQSARQLLTSPVIIVNPNDLFDVAAYKKLLSPGSRTPAAVLLSYRVAEYFPGGYLVADKQGNLQEIVEKPPKGKEPSDLVTMLVHRHNDVKKLLELIDKQPTGKDDIYERALGALAKNTKSVKVQEYSGPWSAIKYPWHILDAVTFILDSTESYISPKASISKKATIEGKVIIGDNARVLENTVIRGPVYIGENSVIGNNCLVRGYSHIGANCTVGFGTEIKGSYLGDGTMTHMNYIGDSVVGENCSFGAGTVTANWRLDEKPVKVRVQNELIDTGRTKFGAVIGNEVKTGVNVSLMPGVKIAAGTLVPAGAVVKKDIE